MKKKIHFVLLLILLSFFGSSVNTFCQDKASGSIKSIQYPTPDFNLEFPEINYIDMGMCMQGDSLVVSFELFNTGIREISLAPQEPSYYLGQSVLETSDFQLLHSNILTQRLIQGKNRDTVRIVYRTENNVSDPLSKNKEARLKLGLFDPDSVPLLSQLKQSDLITTKWYNLRFRKTNKVLDGLENFKNLELVYVNPTDTVWYNWTVQNSSIRGLTVEKQDTNWLSARQQEANPEFFFDFYKSSVNFPENQKFQRVNWKVGYYPVDTVADKIEISLAYKPDPLNFPDSIDFVRDTIRGYGVIQKLKVNQDCCVRIDSIYNGTLTNGKEVIVFDIGKVLRNEIKKFQVCFSNDGNIPFRAKSVKILNETNNQESDFFKTDYDEFTNVFIQKNGSGIIVDSFQANTAGIYKARLVFESDIAERGIKGFPQEAREVVFLLKAEVVEPKIKLASDYVEFNNIVLCPENPSVVVDSFRIENVGKALLQINNIRIEPTNSPFYVEPINLEIPPGPGTFKTAYIRINTDGLDVNKDYNAKLFIESNSFAPDNIKEVSLNARFVEPSTTTMRIFSELKAQPGRLINVPILVDGKKIDIARTFRDTLSFEKYLLAFDSFETIGTATEGASETILAETTDGNLAINIRMPSRVYFSQSDTLIVLKFRTYLGNKISTDISFRNPELGNGICTKVLNIIQSNGLFSLDSVCGLEYKAVPQSIKNFSMVNIYPNPVEQSFKILFNIKDQTNLKIELIDLYGQVILEPVTGNFNQGDYDFSVNTTGLTPGVYNIVISDSYYYDVFRIVVAR